MSTPTKIKKIRLGICMAGAVSAGAYTAGVMDYLIEALERWERLKAKERQRAVDNPGYQYRIPMHDVEIVMLGGASAGGMTAAIAARALAETIEHISTEELREKYKTAKPGAKGLNNLLYQAWVKLTKPDMLNELLCIKDLDKFKNVRSLLNSKFKEDLAEKILEKNLLDKPVTRPYIHKQLDLLLTLCNFSGVTVKYPFHSAGGEKDTFFSIRLHRDFAHFSVGEETALPGRIPVDFKNLNTKILAQAAMATGAFPVGFEARIVERPTEILGKNRFLKAMWGQLPKIIDPDNPERQEDVRTLNADGGTLNNEPFDLVQAVMDQRFPSAKNGFNSKDTHNILLMIDPFPDNDSGDDDMVTKMKRNLFQVIPSLFNAILNQGRAKPHDIQTACSSDLNRFIIAPSRAVPGKPDIEGSRAIACGALGGFSGFVDEAFREHDFFLGRKNCQRFLQRYFSVPKNDFFHPEYYPVQASDNFEIYTEENNEEFATGKIPILPDLSNDGFRVPLENPPPFPVYQLDKLKRYKNLALIRVRKIILLTIRPTLLQKIMFFLGVLLTLPFSPFLLLAAYLYIKRHIWKKINNLIADGLRKWELSK
ncbi:MAG: patatin-like phospholipase family protein [Saprospiraceae bacterium]